MFDLMSALGSFIWAYFYPIVAKLLLLSIDLMPNSSSWSTWKHARSLSPNVDKKTQGRKHILFFCPSLGEYEAVRSLISYLKATNDDVFIEVTCFSPSAYEALSGKIPHNANLISYSPIDTKQGVTDFFKIRDVHKMVFSSLALWPALLNHLLSTNIPYSFVGVQVKSGFLKSIYYNSLSQYLIGARFISVINQKEASLLSNISQDIKTVISGDPRIDSIIDQLKSAPPLDEVRAFCDGQKVIVFGSTHPEDHSIITPIISQLINSNYKVIIAPHDVIYATDIIKNIEAAQLYSLLLSGHGGHVLIIDQLGLLKHIYALSDIAYVGGGFSNELHNIVEPMLADNVIITAPKLSKSYMAQKLENAGAISIVKSGQELFESINLLSNEENRKKALIKSKEVLKTYAGATEKIANLLQI